jgi:CheY-like chemotaxis protein
MNSKNRAVSDKWESFKKVPVNISPGQFQKYRILCVDDEIIGSTMRGEILKEHGYSVVLYHCPLEVLHCDFSMFDLAILDFEMPGLNGRELFLRMRVLGARFPIVLLTGYADALSYEDRALFARFLDKGMPIQRLLETIGEFLDPNQVPDCGT